MLLLPPGFDGTAFLTELLSYIALILPVVALIAFFIGIKSIMKKGV